ncbi:MAG: flagellar protein FlaG [Aquificaceae bacterium]|nr:flagellar protein FlaG [Aquificaceae bacterium]
MKLEPADISKDVKNFQIFQVQQGAIEGMKKQVEREVQRAREEVSEDIRANTEELQKLIEEIKKKFDMLSKYLRIDIDIELEIPVAKIIEKETNRVIRQIPPDYLLDLIKKIDQMLGVLLQKEV